MTSPKAIVLVVFMALMSGARAATVPMYTAAVVGPPDSDYVNGSAINSAGDITGAIGFQAFIQSGSTIRYLGTFGGPGSWGHSINSRGQVAGSAEIAGGSNHAFFYGGTLQDLGTLGGSDSWAYGINDSGQVTGKSYIDLFSTTHAFLYSGGTMRDLGTLGGEESSGNGINAAGQVTGAAELVGVCCHAFLYSGGPMVDLGTGGGERSAGTAINDLGQITGVISFSGNLSSHAFLYSGGSMIDIGTLGGPDGAGYGINNHTQVVGAATTSTGSSHAFLYTNGMMYDLNTIVVSGLSGRTLTTAVSINDQGQILAQSCLPPGLFMAPPKCKTFRLDPASATPLVSVSPPAPNSVDRPMIIVTVPGGAYPGGPSSLSKSIQGNLIQLGLCQNGLDFGPNPPFAVSYVLGPLAPGQYTVQFESRCSPGDPIKFAASFQFQVVDATQTSLRSAVEFFRDNANHYFVTAEPVEIDALDSGHFPGWRRTGQTIGVYTSATPLSSSLSPVCRFYGRPEAGLDSHFFSASPAECQAVIDRFPNAWILESANVFIVGLPDITDGSCPAGFAPVYRLYNNRPDSNHEYTTSFVNRQIFVSQFGWIPEGYGPDAVAMCSPTQ